MKANFKELDKLVDQGMLRKVYSDDKKLVLYNYTDACTYSRTWNKHTINARGTVYEVSTGNVVALAFKKFYNFEELSPTVQRYILKQTNFTAYEKMDGSLGIIFFYDGRWYVNTRGSFGSDQAVEGLHLLHEKYDTSKLNKNYTYLNEIITPNNRIILDYQGKAFLPCLAVMDMNTLREMPRDEYLAECERVGFEIPKIYEFSSIEEIIKWKKEIGSDEEGTVVQYFQNGKPERVKFKSAAYLEVARILSNVNFLSLWANMAWGEVSEEFLEKIPEEFRHLTDETQQKLENSFHEKLDELLDQYQKFISSLPEGYTMKDFALKAKESSYEKKGLFFEVKKFQDEVKKEDIENYKKVIFENLPELRKNPDETSTAGISPNQLRMHIKLFCTKDSLLSKIHNLEKAVMEDIRPSGNKT